MSLILLNAVLATHGWVSWLLFLRILNVCGQSFGTLWWCNGKLRNESLNWYNKYSKLSDFEKINR